MNALLDFVGDGDSPPSPQVVTVRRFEKFGPLTH